MKKKERKYKENNTKIYGQEKGHFPSPASRVDIDGTVLPGGSRRTLNFKIGRENLLTYENRISAVSSCLFFSNKRFL